MNEVLKAIKSRRSVRSFKQEQISQETLDLILEAGTYAPSAHNQQTWHFTVIQNQELLREINETARAQMAKSDMEWARSMSANPLQVTYQAPTLIVVSGKKDGIAWEADCAAAIQNMLIAAESLSVGSVWLGLVRFFYLQEGACEKLGIPDGYVPYYSVALGYKANEKPQAAPRRAGNVVQYIR